MTKINYNRLDLIIKSYKDKDITGKQMANLINKFVIEVENGNKRTKD